MNRTIHTMAPLSKYYWKTILGTLRFRVGVFSASCLAWACVLLGTQIVSLANKYFFNLLEGKSSYPYIGFWTFVLVLIMNEIWRSSWAFGGFTFGALFFQQTRTLLIKNILLNIYKRPGAQVLKESSGDAINRIRDADAIPYFMGTWTTYYVGLSFFVFFSVVVMLRISVFITVITLLPFMFVVIISTFMMRKVEQFRRESRITAGHVASFINEMFASIQAVKAASAEKNMIRQFDKINILRRKAVVKDVVFFTTLKVAFESTTTIGLGIIMLIAGKQIQNGSFSIGDLALFTIYLQFISEWSASSGTLIARLGQINVNIKRMLEFIENKNQEDLIEFGPIYMKNEPLKVSEIGKTSNDLLNTLEVKDLNFRYPNSEASIKNASFTIKKHTLTIITGRIGSGKTTLLQSLLGLRPADKGIIKWNGKIIDSPSNFFTPPRCAYTPQIPRLQSLSLRDNITFGQPFDDCKLNNVLHQAVLEKDITTLEKGLNTLVGPKGVKLSGGQIQRAAAARMFFTQAELMVFDDLSSALDVDTELKFWQRIFEQKNATYLAVSHSSAALKLADNILVLKDGAIDAQGKLNDLKESCTEFQYLWRGIIH